eukprot:1518382-Rhodomonas_salina.2
MCGLGALRYAGSCSSAFAGRHAGAFAEPSLALTHLLCDVCSECDSAQTCSGRAVAARGTADDDDDDDNDDGHGRGRGRGDNDEDEDEDEDEEKEKEKEDAASSFGVIIWRHQNASRSFSISSIIIIMQHHHLPSLSSPSS